MPWPTTCAMRADVAEEAERGLVAFGEGAAQLLVAGGAREVRRHQRQLAADALAAGGAQQPDAHHRLLGVVAVRRTARRSPQISPALSQTNIAPLAAVRTRAGCATPSFVGRCGRPLFAPSSSQTAAPTAAIASASFSVAWRYVDFGHQATLPFDRCELLDHLQEAVEHVHVVQRSRRRLRMILDRDHRLACGGAALRTCRRSSAPARPRCHSTGRRGRRRSRGSAR